MNYGRRVLTILLLALGILLPASVPAGAVTLLNDTHMESSGLYQEGIRTVHMVEFVGDTCYAYMDDESVRICKEDGTLTFYTQLPAIAAANPYLAPKEDDLMNIVTHMTVGEKGLYGYNIYTGQFGTMDESGIHWQATKLQMDCLRPYGDLSTYRIARSFVTDNKLYIFASLTEYQDETGYLFWSFDLTTGESTTYKASNAVGVCQGLNGQVFFLCQEENTWSIQALDLETQILSPLTVNMSLLSGDDVVCGLIYDAVQNQIYVASKGQVYSGPPDGAMQPVGSINTEGCMSESSAWLLSEERYALCSMIGLNIVRIGTQDSALSQLIVQVDDAIKLNTIFQSAYPTVMLNCIPEQISSDELAKRMVIQDDSVDVYKIKADSIFTSMKNKGMVADLSENDMLIAQKNTLSADVVDAITDSSGRLVAYPASLSISTFEINQGYWNMVFGTQPVPTTMEELMDAWITFEEEYADLYPDLDMWFGFDEQQLCRLMILHYLQTHDTPVDLVYKANSALYKVLDKLAQVASLRREYDRCLTAWTPDEAEGRATIVSLFGDREAMYDGSGIYLETGENLVYGLSMFDYTPLTLQWGDGDSQSTNASLMVYVVNPYTKHKEEAISYIECATQLDANPYLYYAVHPDCNAPYEKPSFMNSLSGIRDDIATLEKQLQEDSLEASERSDLEAMLDYNQTVVDKQEQLRWLISEDTIQRERKLLANVNFHLDNLYLTAIDSSAMISTLCNQYVDGRITLDKFLQELVSKLSLIEKESN